MVTAHKPDNRACQCDASGRHPRMPGVAGRVMDAFRSAFLGD